jgi:DNA-3-methyladenine glycosylase II
VAPRKGLAHLRRCDPVLAALIASVGPLGDAREGRPDRQDHYGALVRSITGQQLSVLAARAIYGRLTARFDGRAPTPAEVLSDDPEELRAAAGLSRAKVSYLRSLAEHVISGELELERLDELGDEEVVAELVAVKGLGLWTAQMFLMFHLERPDVLPVGDLGIRRAIERAYALEGPPDPAAMEAIAEPWRPHRTLACRYLWRSLANEPG